MEGQANWQLANGTKTPDQIIAELSKNGVALVFYPVGPSAGPRAGTFKAVLSVDARGNPVPYKPAPSPPRVGDAPARLSPDLLRDVAKCRDGLVDAAKAKGLAPGIDIRKGPAADVIILAFPGGQEAINIRMYPSGISVNRPGANGAQVFFLTNDSFFTFRRGAEWLEGQAKFLALKKPVEDAARQLNVPPVEAKAELRESQIVITLLNKETSTSQAYFFKFDEASGMYVAANGTGYPGAAMPAGAPASGGAVLGPVVTPDLILRYVREKPARPRDVPRPKTPEQIAAEDAADKKFTHELFHGMMESALQQAGLEGSCSVRMEESGGVPKVILSYPGGSVAYDVYIRNNEASLRPPGSSPIASRRVNDRSTDGIMRSIDGIAEHVKALQWLAQPAQIPGRFPGASVRFDPQFQMVRMNVPVGGRTVAYGLRWDSSTRSYYAETNSSYANENGGIVTTRPNMTFGSSNLDISRAADRIQDELQRMG